MKSILLVVTLMIATSAQASLKSVCKSKVTEINASRVIAENILVSDVGNGFATIQESLRLEDGSRCICEASYGSEIGGTASAQCDTGSPN